MKEEAMRRVQQGMIPKARLAALQVQYDNLKTKHLDNLEQFCVTLLEKTRKIEQANIFKDQLSTMVKMADTTLIMCRDLCQQIVMHATPIATFYNIAWFLHMKDKLNLNVRPLASITSMATSTMEDQWKGMIEEERNMFCLRWATN